MISIIRNFVNKLGFDIVRKVEIKPSAYNSYPIESIIYKKFYNIGAGQFYHKFWTNIDYDSDHYKKKQKKNYINYDLMKLDPLPIDTETAELIYSSHTIEHVSDEAVRNLLKESYRILKTGGGIRLTAPDAFLEYRAYQRQDISYWYWVDQFSRKGSWEKQYMIPLSKASIHQLFLHHFASQLCEIDIDQSPKKKYSDFEISRYFKENTNIEALDFFTKQCKFNPRYPGKHINWWTHDKLIKFLQEAGFQSIYSSGYGQSIFAPLRDTRYFDNTHPMISLYVEAYK